MTAILDKSQGGAGAIGLATTVVRNWKAPIALGFFAVVSIVLFGVFGRDGVSSFTFSEAHAFIQIPAAHLPSRPIGVIVPIVLLLIAAYATWLVSAARKVPIWLVVVFAVLDVVTFLVWAGVGQTIKFSGDTSLLWGAIALSAPLIFGALGGVIGERVGVVNVAIEGQLLGGAFVSILIASATGSLIAGLVAAAVAGTVVAFILAAFSIKYLVDQVIVGVVVNVFVSGLTGFLYSEVLSPNPALNNPDMRFKPVDIPVLSDIPVIGPVLFHQTVIVYIMYVAVAAVWYGLFHTRWGLRLRARGEHPQAADTVGIKVNSGRFWNVLLAGAIVGLGGAYFTLGSVGAFGKDMTGGLGYIALAAVIFGRWDPLRATLAALLFGFTQNLAQVLPAIHAPVPSEFLLMLPYVVTVVAVAGFVGSVRGPAASGKPYIKS